MSKKLIPPALFTSSGMFLFVFASWWGNQTGYYNSDPANRDANIGAGLLVLLGIAVTACGVLWLIVELVKYVRHH